MDAKTTLAASVQAKKGQRLCEEIIHLFLVAEPYSELFSIIDEIHVNPP